MMRIRNCVRMLKRLREFKKDIRLEMADPESKFNQFKMSINRLGDVIYVQLDFDNKDLMANRNSTEAMVLNKVFPIDAYLEDDLDWLNDLSREISQFYDTKGNPTYSFLVKYTMFGVNEALNSLLKYAIGLVSCGIIIGVITALILSVG